MPRENWNDDRLDDQADEIRTQGEAITFLGREVVILKERVRTLMEERAQGISNRFQWWMIAATFISNPITAVVVYYISKGK